MSDLSELELQSFLLHPDFEMLEQELMETFPEPKIAGVDGKVLTAILHYDFSKNMWGNALKNSAIYQYTA